ILAGMTEVCRVMTVCWGNICRSPMAEFMVRAAVDSQGLGDVVEVSSCGVSAEEVGNGMDRRAVAALRRHGVADSGFAGHRARQFEVGWFGEVDLLLPADYRHERMLRSLAGGDDEAGKIRMIREFDPAAVASGDVGMADPWYGGDEDFDVTFAQIAGALPGIVGFVRDWVESR
ncbi:low molecular weight protein-tyrosine-phosphatase, partial [Dermatophilus congolensis]|uniref:low molecular weight protein-tyrosine-phosphatase n=2 Tax=Dermatophilus congolensis TaxID=1863 RepID=UPI00312C9016